MPLSRVEYCSWEKAVTAFIAALSGGISIHDIEDFPFREAYAEGMSPRTTAEKAIESLRNKKT